MIRALWRSFRKDETAQALAEYCLVTALVALLGLGIFIHVSGGMQNIWGAAESAIAAAGPSTPAGNATASAPGSR